MNLKSWREVLSCSTDFFQLGISARRAEWFCQVDHRGGEPKETVKLEYLRGGGFGTGDVSSQELQNMSAPFPSTALQAPQRLRNVPRDVCFLPSIISPRPRHADSFTLLVRRSCFPAAQARRVSHPSLSKHGTGIGERLPAQRGRRLTGQVAVSVVSPKAIWPWIF